MKHHEELDEQLKILLSEKESPPDYVINETIQKVTSQEQLKDNKWIGILGIASLLLFWVEIAYFLQVSGYSTTTLAIYTLLSSSLNLVIGFIFLQKRIFRNRRKLQ